MLICKISINVVMGKIDKKKEKILKDATKKGGKFISDFKSFIARGNVVDLAVGVVIGSAFGKIVSSVVDDILMPIIGVLIGGIDFSSLSIKVGEAKITYGSFIQNVIDFLIIALFVFIVVKIFEKFSKKEEEEAEAKEDEKVVLLREIRDALKKENADSKTKSE